MATTTNGHKTPAVEYAELIEVQKRIDAELEAAHFTGPSFDQVTGDWCCWQEGRIIGWAKSPGEAARRVQECYAAQAAHPQPAVLGTMREENPCSIELQLSAKGEHYWTLKSYHAPGGEQQALFLLQELDAELTRRYRPELLPAS